MVCMEGDEWEERKEVLDGWEEGADRDVMDRSWRRNRKGRFKGDIRPFLII